MDIGILSLFPATIVVSTERENEFEQYVRTSQAWTRERTRQADEKNDAKYLYQKESKELQKLKCYAESHSQSYSRT